MASPLLISLRYQGPDVDSGTMPIDEVADALQGFAGAYGKTASLVSSDVTHQLRVAAIRPGSFELVILAWAALGQYPEQIHTLEMATRAARFIVGLIGKIVSLKKHTRGLPYSVSIRGDNNTFVVLNADGAQLEIPPQALEIYKSKLIDSDLNKIASPLRAESVESAEIRATDDEGETLEAQITSKEREYFRPDASILTSKEIELVGTLISLNKETNRGTFKRGNNENVPYHYVGDNPDGFHADFAYKGPVRTTAIAHFDENLSVIRIDIKAIQRLQSELPLT